MTSYRTKPLPEDVFAFDLNPYDSFMKNHLSHYGYYTGKNASYRNSMTSFEEWEKTHGYGQIGDSSDDSNSDNEDDDKAREDLRRTTQVVYNQQEGKLVPKLKEARPLYGFSAQELGTQQSARWPAEIQVLPDPIKHIQAVPKSKEPFYKHTGLEKTPLAKSHEQYGRLVFEYQPVLGNFFLRSRVGGARTGCSQATINLVGVEDTTLLFESRFESGNLAKAVEVSTNEYELWLRNDLYTQKHTQWYYFRCSNTRANTSYRFTIVNLMKPDSLYNQGMRPLIYSEKAAQDKKIGWVRGCEGIKYYRNNIRCPSTNKWYYSLTWTITFEYDNDTVYFAHCYPYTYTDLQNYLNDIQNDPVKSKICKQRILCRTLAGNMVTMLTITSPSKNADEAKHRKAVVMTSRVHPGETNASWMMKGFIDYIMGNSADAKLLRDTFIFKVIPMLNPDGVIVGNYRCSLAGRDLNRNYKSMLKDSFPTVWNTRAMIKKLAEEREIVVYCDLHGHSRKQNVFIYGCENRGDSQRRLRERIFPVMLNKNAPDKFSFDSCKFKVQKSKEGTGRIVVWRMGIMNSYTMEATFCGSSLGKMKGFHFSTADFESLGYHFCDTLLDYCDPDNTKAANILLDLEDRIKKEILQHLQQKQGPDATLPKNLEEINLDEDFSSSCESSDGGSDSSVSDGLPVHFQYMQDKFNQKKKRLKSRKERDKHKCTPNSGKTDKSEKKAPTPECGKEPLIKPKQIKYSMGVIKRPKSKEEKVSSASTVDKKEPSSKPEEGYLEALTNAYMKSGILVSAAEQPSHVPHFRYTGNRPAGGLPPNMTENMCPHHEQAFAAQYVASHLQQHRDHLQMCKFPDDLRDDSSKYRQKSAKGGERPFSGIGGSGLERRPLSRHLVEISASQQRQQDLLHQQELQQKLGHVAQDQRFEDPDSPIKSHPRPFDESHRNAMDSRRDPLGHSAKSTLSRRNSAISVGAAHRAKSAKSGTSVQRFSETQVILGGKAMKSAFETNNDKVKLGSQVKKLHRGGNPSNNHQLNNHSRRNSPNTELADTMKSINELKEELLQSTKRKNMSPTTEQFVEHFVRKTDEEIRDITADLKSEEFQEQDVNQPQTTPRSRPKGDPRFAIKKLSKKPTISQVPQVESYYSLEIQHQNMTPSLSVKSNGEAIQKSSSGGKRGNTTQEPDTTNSGRSNLGSQTNVPPNDRLRSELTNSNMVVKYGADALSHVNAFSSGLGQKGQGQTGTSTTSNGLAYHSMESFWDAKEDKSGRNSYRGPNKPGHSRKLPASTSVNAHQQSKALPLYIQSSAYGSGTAGIDKGSGVTSGSLDNFSDVNTERSLAVRRSVGGRDLQVCGPTRENTTVMRTGWSQITKDGVTKSNSVTNQLHCEMAENHSKSTSNKSSAKTDGNVMPYTPKQLEAKAKQGQGKLNLYDVAQKLQDISNGNNTRASVLNKYASEPSMLTASVTGNGTIIMSKSAGKRVLPSSRQQPREVYTDRVQGQGYHPSQDGGMPASGKDVPYETNPSQVRKALSSADPRYQLTSPTKISLMISRGHNSHHSSETQPNQFFTKPLTGKASNRSTNNSQTMLRLPNLSRPLTRSAHPHSEKTRYYMAITEAQNRYFSDQ